MLTVDLIHALHCIITFSHHVHFKLRLFNTVSFAKHRAEHPVTAELRISRYKEIAEVRRRLYITVNRMNFIYETFYFLDSVAHKYRQEIIAVTQTVTNAAGNSNHVF